MDQFAPRNFRIDADHAPTMIARITMETAGDYARFRRTLTADYGVVWRDIAVGYAALLAVVLLVAQASGWVGLVASVPGAIAIGFVIAYLQLFIHEAAHWNLAHDRRTSDRIANIFIAWQVGTSIAAYRRVHFEHHRHLGHEKDGERSYVHRLSLHLLAELITGIHALRVFLARGKGSGAKAEPASKAPLLRGAAVHVGILAIMLGAGAWSAALAWIGGMAIFFPVFATLRPLLEHRPARSDDALLVGERGAVTRTFRDGPLARTFGAAGFSRHLLHHWEPQVSYTRLAELEAYLSDTPTGAILDARRTTYARAFRDILVSDRG